MMGLPRGVLWLLGIFTITFNSDLIAAQTKRTSRLTNSRTTFNINTKSSNGHDFDCPEEFGYYPHPNDCSQYYVCVFGGALLESCTGGLMYSHELQTCDWPRNVGCELTDINSQLSARDNQQRLQQIKTQQQQHQNHVPHRVRFGSLPISSTTQQPPKPTIAQQYHRQTSPQSFQPQIQTLPPPPELRVAPNPVITSRGQPKPLLESQEDIAKLYAEAHDTLPPAEEEESDRQQRVYRGQPSTVGQVQRDRDGIIHHANVNALPNHGKVGSYAYGSQLNQFRIINDNTIDSTENLLKRNRRDTEIIFDHKNQTILHKDIYNDKNITKDKLQNLNEHFNNDNIKYTENSKIVFDTETNEKIDEFLRSPRQLRQLQNRPTNWHFPSNNNNYRSINSKPYQQDVFEFFTPYLSPPGLSANQFYKNNDNLYNLNNNNNNQYNQPNKHNQQFNTNYKSIPFKYHVQPTVRPQNLYSTSTKSHFSQSDVIPLLIEGFRSQFKQPLPLKKPTNDPDNFAYFHLANEELPPNHYTIIDDSPSPDTQTYSTRYNDKDNMPVSKPHYHAFSTVGGFYNNDNHLPMKQTVIAENNKNNDGIVSTTSKIISKYTIPTTTQSNYFQYNILQNQRMKNYFVTTAKSITTEQPPTTFNNFHIVSGPDFQTTFGKFNKNKLPTTVSTIGNTENDKNTEIHKSTGFHYTTPTAIVYQNTGSLHHQQKPFTNKQNFMGNLKINNPTTNKIETVNNIAFDKLVNAMKEKHFQPVTSNLSTSTERTTKITKNHPTTIKSIENENNKNIYRPEISTPYIKSVIVTPKPPKGYESFINSIPQKKPNRPSITITNNDTIKLTNTPPIYDDDEYYYEDEDDVNDNDDYGVDPPSDKPPYMPNSETMAPRPYNKPLTTTPQYKSQTIQITTHRPLFTLSHFSTINNDNNKDNIPSIISFPTDIFQNLKPIKYFNNYIKNSSSTSMTTLTTDRTLITKSIPSTKKTIISTTTTTSKPTTRQASSIGSYSITTSSSPYQSNNNIIKKTKSTIRTTTRKTYTVRSNRGNMKWKFIKTTSKPDSRKRRPIQQQQIELDDKYSNRETSSHSPPSSAGNIFIQQQQQQQRPKTTNYEQNIRNNNNNNNKNNNNNNNYYNVTKQNYDPTPFDTYYSLYDDDVDLYRDVEYQHQQQQQQQQQQQEQNRGNKVQQSTYRPAEVITSSQVPVRETYVSKVQLQQQQQQQQQQQPAQQYNQPSLIYNTDYDDSLISQIEQDNNAYNQPTRAPTRGDTIDKNLITINPITTISSITLNDSNINNDDDNNDENDDIENTISSTSLPIYRLTTPIPTLYNDIESSTEQLILNSTKFYKPYPIPIILKDQYTIFKTTTPITKTTPFTTTTRSPTLIKTTAESVETTTMTTLQTLIPITTTPIQNFTTQTQTTHTSTPSTRSTLLEDGINNQTSDSLLLSLSSSGSSNRSNKKNPDFSNSYHTIVSSTSSITKSTGSSTPFPITYSSSSSQPIPSLSFYPNTQLLENNDNVQTDDIIKNTYTLTNNNDTTNNKPKIISLLTKYGTINRPSLSQLNDKKLYSNSQDKDEQRKRILSFIVSDEEPQAFKPQIPLIESTTKSTTILSPTFSSIYYQPEKVTISSAKPTQSDTIVPHNSYTYRLTTGTGTGGYNLRTQSTDSTEKLEEIPPIYIRPLSQLKIPIKDEIIDPTTYAPPKPWRIIRTSPSPFNNQDSNLLNYNNEDNQQSDSIYSFQREQLNKPNDIVSTSGSELTPVTEKSTSERIQSFTSRALVFKDNLRSKSYETTGSSKYVSPYTSLKTLLDSKEEKLKYSSVKPNLKTRYSTSAPYLYPTQKPFRSYFLITSSTKEPSNYITPTASALKYSPTPNRESTSTSTTSSTIPTTSPSTTTTAFTTTLVTASTSTTPTSTIARTEEPIAFVSSTTYLKRDPDVQDLSSRGKSRYTVTVSNSLENDEPTTYAPKNRLSTQSDESRFSTPISSSTTELPIRRKIIRPKLTTQKLYVTKPTVMTRNQSRYEFASPTESLFGKYLEQYSSMDKKPKAYALVQGKETINSHENETLLSNLENYGFNESEENPNLATSIEEQRIVEITDRPAQFFTRYRQLSTEKNLAEAIQGYNELSQLDRLKFKASVDFPEIHSSTETEKLKESTTKFDNKKYGITEVTIPVTLPTLPTRTTSTSTTTYYTEPTTTQTTTTTASSTSTEKSTTYKSTTTTKLTTTNHPKTLLPPRASRVNNAIKTSIAASSRTKVTSTLSKCADNTPNTKCNEIPSRTTNRNRGSSHSHFNSDADKPSAVTSNRGTHPPRSRPTLKPAGSIVSKAAEFIDIYKNPPTRSEPLYPQPTPDKTAAKCRKDVCLLPDCYCGGKEIPGDLPVESLPQIVLLTFDDSVNDLNKLLYSDLFEKGRVNPNGCPITATFYVSHEWTDYSQVQNLYADGHEMASHTVSHSFGEQFSQKKWTREIAGQREILSAYGGVKLNDVRGMRAPFLSIGGNKMFKMLYDSNFTYDSSMPVYENRPPSWPYTLDYKIFHDCMIPPCPTKSYPGVWEVPMVMWQDLNGGRCSMGDACSNPSDADNVYKMIMKNFDRHYTTNRAPFGLFYHAAWFTQPHHKEGFIKFLDAINAMSDVWIVTNWQALQWIRDPTPLSRINHFQPFQCDYSDRPKRCNNPKVCNLWHKSGVRYMRTCQPCPDIYPWTGKTGIRSSRVDNEIIEE